jgi:hypothetical protein
MEISKRENIVIAWFVWHFYEAPKFLLYVWKNYLSFGLDFFSMPLLFSTLFSPWRNYKWRYPKGFSISGYFNVFISNTFSRIIGAMCRVLLIFFGVITQIVILILGAVVLIFWIGVPFIIIALIAFLVYGRI